MHTHTSRKTIDDEIEQFASDVTGQFAKHSRAHRELEFSELDAAQFVAIQLVIPIVASFVSSLLYDKFKNLKTKKQAQSALETLCKTPVPSRRPIRKDTVLKEMSERLTVSVESQEAATIVTSCYERLARQFEYQQID
jgi:hypothetical protein